jgi:ribonuclease G
MGQKIIPTLLRVFGLYSKMENPLPIEIIISTTGRESRIALLDNGQLSQLHIDRGNNKSYVGNIYFGKVVRVLPGMQAAFVDIGLDRAAFLYAGDIYPEFLEKTEKDVEDPEATIAESAPRSKPRPGTPPIQDLVKEGQHLLVQVAKDPISTKGARIKTHITLPGRFTVFMPTVDHVGISRRIDRDKERRALRDFVEKNRPKGCGFIVRTVCAGQPLEALEKDMTYLTSTWATIQEKAQSSKPPSLLHADHNLALRVVRDSFTENAERLLVDSVKTFKMIQNFVKIFAPNLLNRVRLYKGQEPIFDVCNIESMISRSLTRKVWLKSGGYLIIDKTEALTAIDVNTGRYVGSRSLEDTTLDINLEAVQEISNQLRLRNMGGIIVLDFIDMENAGNRERVYRSMEDALREDKARTNILKISDLGLIEMTRKRVQEDLVSSISEVCTYCEGTGQIRAQATIVYEIIREVKRTGVRKRNQSFEHILVNCHPAVADMMYNQELSTIERLEDKLHKRIVIRAMGHYHQEKYEVYCH